MEDVAFPAGFIFDMHGSQAHRKNDEGQRIADDDDIEHAFGQLAFRLDFAHYVQYHCGRSRHAECRNDGGDQLADAELREEYKQGNEGERAQRHTGDEQALFAQQPFVIDAASKFEQHQAECEINQQTDFAQQRSIDQVERGRSDQQTRQYIAGDGGDLREYAPEQMCAQHACYQQQAGCRQYIECMRQDRKETV